MRRATLLLMLSGCANGTDGNYFSPPRPAEATDPLAIVLTGDDDALHLAQAPADRTYHADYPNPRGFHGMSVTVRPSGDLTPTCTDEGGARVACYDTPFFTKVDHGADGVTVHVTDVYGVECATVKFPGVDVTDGGGASQDGDGETPCCDCTCGCHDSGNGPDQPACDEQGALKTRDKYCQALNDWLGGHGMHPIACDKLDAPGYDDRPRPPAGTPREACDAIWGEPYTTIVMRWSKGCECYAERTVHWNNVVRSLLIDEGACAHSPIVLDLDGDGVNLGAVDEGVPFDLLGGGERVTTAWPSGGDALLALDRDGDGAIDGARELFGPSTAGRTYADGFAALADLDANGDGFLDRRDPAFRYLVVWRDADRDGRSARSELASLDEAGIARLETEAARVEGEAAYDAHANRVPLVASFERADGTRARMVDAFLRWRRAR